MSEIYRAFLKHQAAIRRALAPYCKNAEEIEDLSQETFVKGFAAEMKGEIREPRAFLLRIAKNLAIGERRRHVHKITDFVEDLGGSDILKDGANASAEERLDAKRKLVVFSQAVAALPPALRQALIMRKMEHLTFKQIATRLNVSQSSVEKRVAKALIACHVHLRKHGYDPSEFGPETMKGADYCGGGKGRDKSDTIVMAPVEHVDLTKINSSDD